MLLFELFPAFLAILSVVIGVLLFSRELKARRDHEPLRQPAKPAVNGVAERDAATARPRRPSMEP